MPRLPPELTEPSVIDASAISSLREQLGGQDSVLDRIVQLYLDELPGRLAAIRSALEEADARALRDAAHALRGSSATLGATLAAEISEELEHRARAADLAIAPVLLERLEDAARRTVTAFEAELGRGPLS